MGWEAAELDNNINMMIINNKAVNVALGEPRVRRKAKARAHPLQEGRHRGGWEGRRERKEGGRGQKEGIKPRNNSGSPFLTAPRAAYLALRLLRAELVREEKLLVRPLVHGRGQPPHSGSRPWDHGRRPGTRSRRAGLGLGRAARPRPIGPVHELYKG